MSFARQGLFNGLKGVIEIILFLPVLILLYVNIPFTPSFAAWMALLGVFYLVGAYFAQWLQYTYLILYIGFSLVSSIGAVWLLWGLHFAEFVTIALCNFAFYRGCSLALNRWKDSLPMTAWWISLAIYFLTSIFFSRYVQYDAYMILFAIAGFTSLIATLWRTNVLILREVNLGDKQPTRIATSVLRHNRIAIFAMVALIVMITFLNVIQNTVLKLAQHMKDWLVKWLGSGSSNQRVDDPIFETPMTFPETVPGTETSLIMLIVQFVGYVLTAIALVFLLVFFVRKLVRLSGEGWRKLLSILRQKGFLKKDAFTSTTTGYVDEEQKLLKLTDVGKLYRDRFGQWLAERLKREPKWDDLSDNKARIRFLYRHWLLRKVAAGVAIDEALTPREVGEQLAEMGDDRRELVAMYDAARYGGDSPRTLGALSDDAVARERARERE